ncbi:hypothetical protein ACN09N_01835 [Aliarcobacter butzleri]|uniref:hypothetical protein n=1 Tax=Aliarcobacter butzleri TaxID=28197 RepID=UPI001EE0E44C|nr:hypothetical protein [Aliarcobacter butzleri]MCG3695428.1 hypothetical protein [Aliarcobacter butzleri]
MAIEWVAERLISLLPIIGNVSKDKREVADKALYAISEALTETCLYVNKYVENGKRDEKIEAQLVRYWANAAIPIRHIDSELSSVCEYKSEYWLNPSNWKDSNSNGLVIDLESVRKQYRKKLKL